MTEEQSTDTPPQVEQPKKNRHLRRANGSPRAKKKALKYLAEKMPGLDLSRISGKIVIDGIEIRGTAAPVEEQKQSDHS